MKHKIFKLIVAIASALFTIALALLKLILLVIFSSDDDSPSSESNRSCDEESSFILNEDFDIIENDKCSPGFDLHDISKQKNFP